MVETVSLLDFRSYRRRLLDAELYRVSEEFRGTVLDVGGGHARGSWTPPAVTDWITVDIVRSYDPDIQATAVRLPVRSNSVDVAKCTEVLEHVRDPGAVVTELERVLKPGGTLVLSMPFNYGIHGDPDDYQRYTEHKLRRLLENGFRIERFAAQGAFWTVLAYMLQRAIINTQSPLKRLLYPVLPVLDQVPKLDSTQLSQESAYQQSFTTGYFVLARRRDE